MPQDRDEAELRDLARLHVRAGLRSPDEQLEAMVEAVGTLMPGTDPQIMARAWLAAARRDLAAEGGAWEVPTDHDRLGAALAECEQHDVLVLPGVDGLTTVRERVESAGRPLRGVLWFSEPQVWHAVDHGVLEAGLRHGDGTPARGEDPLVAAVVGCLGRHGVRARWRDDHVEALVRWQRRPEENARR